MRICLFGGPGCGKSTLASWLFAELKKSGESVELVSEVIKSWANLKRPVRSFDQCYIFGKQLHTEDIVYQAGIKHLVTDSPLLMNVAYAYRYSFPCADELFNIAKKYEIIHPSLNIFLEREGIPYQHVGRYETEPEAHAMDVRIKELLAANVDNWKSMKAINQTEILDYVLEQLK